MPRMRIAVLSLLASLALIACGTGGPSVHPSLVQERVGSYANPMRIAVPNGNTAESCPDPSIIRGQNAGDTDWYLYCTSEMFTDHSRLHYLSISKSTDLVNWTYVGDVFASKPRWVAGVGGLALDFAPDSASLLGRRGHGQPPLCPSDRRRAPGKREELSSLGARQAYRKPTYELGIDRRSGLLAVSRDRAGSRLPWRHAAPRPEQSGGVLPPARSPVGARATVRGWWAVVRRPLLCTAGSARGRN